MSIFFFALLVTAANFAIGFGLAIYLGHGPGFSLDELRALLAGKHPAAASQAAHTTGESKKSGH